MGFFSKVGGSIKKFVTNAASKVKSGIQKIAPTVLKLGQQGLGLLGKIPGTVGTVASGINKGINVVKDLKSHVPNEKAKEKLSSFADKVGSTTGSVADKIGAGVQKATPVMQSVVDASSKAAGALSGIGIKV